MKKMVENSKTARKRFENGSETARKRLVNVGRFLAVLLVLLTIGIGNAWGADITYTFSSKSWAASPANWTSDGDGTAFESASPSRGVQISSSVGVGCTSPVSYSGGVISVSVVASSTTTTGKITINIGSTEIATKDVAKSNNDTYTFGASDNADIATLSGNVQLVVTRPSSGSVYIKSITITYVTEKFTVTYDAGNGECATSSEKQSSLGTALTLPTATPSSTCTDKGWELLGWATSECSATTSTPTFMPAGAKYTPLSNTTLYAVYYQVSNNTVTTLDTMMVSSSLNSNWEAGGRYALNQSRAEKTSIQLMAADATLPNGYIQTNNLYGKVSAVTLSACGTNNNVDTLSYSTNGTTWTNWTNYCAVSSSSSEYFSRSFDLTSFPTGAYYLRITCSKTSHYIFSIEITSKEINYNSNPDCTSDYFIDIMHDTEIAPQKGTYSMPSPSDAVKGETYCENTHYKFVGWVESTYIDEDGTLKSGYTLYPAGDSGHTADNKTFYAIWANEQ